MDDILSSCISECVISDRQPLEPHDLAWQLKTVLFLVMPQWGTNLESGSYLQYKSVVIIYGVAVIRSGVGEMIPENQHIAVLHSAALRECRHVDNCLLGKRRFQLVTCNM